MPSPKATLPSREQRSQLCPGCGLVVVQAAAGEQPLCRDCREDLNALVRIERTLKSSGLIGGRVD
jgi:hypothetical protein